MSFSLGLLNDFDSERFPEGPDFNIKFMAATTKDAVSSSSSKLSYDHVQFIVNYQKQI